MHSLLPEIQLLIAQYLEDKDLIHYAQSSSKHYTLFAPLISTKKFLHHVVRSDHQVVASMLKKDPQLLFKQGEVIDCSERAFPQISGFEYALWALDKHLWNKMLESLPQNETKAKIIANLLVAYRNFKELGVTYTLDGAPVHEHHFDFENTILAELTTQLNALRGNGIEGDVIEEQWQQGVGKAQALLPMHVVHEYCGNNFYNAAVSFTHKPMPSQEFHNPSSGKDELWFQKNSQLGKNFAICKSASEGDVGPHALSFVSQIDCNSDLSALTALYTMRKNEFMHLEQELTEAQFESSLTPG